MNNRNLILSIVSLVVAMALGSTAMAAPFDPVYIGLQDGRVVPHDEDGLRGTTAIGAAFGSDQLIDIAADAAGNSYGLISDGRYVIKTATDTTFGTIISTSLPGTAIGIDLDAAGNVYIGIQDGRVVPFDSSGVQGTTIGTAFNTAQLVDIAVAADGTSYGLISDDRYAVKSTTETGPGTVYGKVYNTLISVGIGVDSDGNVYVAVHDGRVVPYDSSGVRGTTIGAAFGSVQLIDLAVALDGTSYGLISDGRYAVKSTSETGPGTIFGPSFGTAIPIGIAVIPEPSSMFLVGLGSLLALRSRRRT